MCMIITKAHSVITYIIILLGAIHIYFSTCYETFDTDTLWFIGSGIAIILAGLINLMKTKSSDKIVYHVCLITNLLITILFCLALLALHGPQVYIGIILFALAFVLSLNRTSPVSRR